MASICLSSSALPRSRMSSTHLGMVAGTAIVSCVGIRYCGFSSKKLDGFCLCAKKSFHFILVQSEEKASTRRDTLKTGGKRNLRPNERKSSIFSEIGVTPGPNLIRTFALETVVSGTRD